MIIDLKNYLETESSVNVYPMHIPQGSELPAMEISDLFDSRNSDSNLDASNIKDRRFQITIVSTKTETTLDLKTQVVDLLEGFSGVMGDSNILITRVNSTVPLYNKQQQTFEYAIDANFVLLL